MSGGAMARQGLRTQDSNHWEALPEKDLWHFSNGTSLFAPAGKARAARPVGIWTESVTMIRCGG